MAIVKMKKLRLFAIKSQRDELLRKLLLLGCVEVTEPLKEELGEGLAQESGELSKYREWHRDLTAALGILDRYALTKDGFLAPRPEVDEKDVIDGSGEQASVELAEYLIGLDEKHKRLTAEEVNQGNIIESLKPWLNMDIPFDYKGTKSTGMTFGSVPAEVNLTELKSALSAEAEESQVFEISSDKEQQCIVVLYHNDRSEAVFEALRPFWFSKMPLAGTPGTAKENSESATKQLAELANEKVEITEKIVAEKERRTELKLAIDHMSVRVAEQEATEKLLSTKSALVLEGWIPEADVPKLDSLEEFDCAWEVSEPDTDCPDPPVKLKSNFFTQPLNMVTEMYSLPAYHGVDPNPLMFPFFVLFYGIMMADMGYGLLMMIASVVVLKKKRPAKNKGTYNLFYLMGFGGLSTFIFGALTAGFFGDFVKQLLLIMNPESTFEWFWKPLFTPLDDTIMILIGAMCLGAIHLITGMAVDVYVKLKRGQVMDAIADDVTWWVIFAGVALAILGIGNVSGVPVVLVIGLVMLVVLSSRNAKGLGKISAVIGAVYNGVTGYFGDILSYSRLMALMLAGSVIAQVFNTLGAVTGSVIPFLLIAMVGNTLNFGLNLLGCFVHDLRLQCLEFFGKFYEDGGKPFKPLNVDTKYVEVTK